MIVTDRQLTKAEILARLSNGAAFSIVVPRDIEARRGVFNVFGMAIEPYMLRQIDSHEVALENNGNIKAEFYCHFFAGHDVSETIFTERLPIHHILGQIIYNTSTKIEFYYWDQRMGNHSINGWEAFRECLISPQVTIEEDIPNNSLIIYRNKSIFPVFQNGSSTNITVTNTDTIRLNRTNNADSALALYSLIHRGYEARLFGRVRLNPIAESISQEYFIQELVTRLSYNHRGIFTPSMGDNLGYRMCGNSSSIFDFDKVTIPESNLGEATRLAIQGAMIRSAYNFESLNNSARTSTNSVQDIARRLTNIDNRKAAINSIPKEPEPPSYDQFNRERDL